MSSSTTDRKIPVPTSLTSTTPSLPPLTSHLLVSYLRESNSVAGLQSVLSDSLARTGWVDRVRALALELLRNGTCDTFPDLLEEVLRRAKLSKDAKTGTSQSGESGEAAKDKDKDKDSQSNTTAKSGSQANGTAAAGMNGHGAIAVREGWFGKDGLPDVRIPDKTVEVGVEYLKERITDLVEPVGDD